MYLPDPNERFWDFLQQLIKATYYALPLIIILIFVIAWGF